LRTILIVLGVLFAVLVALVVLAIVFAEPGYLMAGESYTDDFSSSDVSLFSECFSEATCPVVIEDGRLRFDVPQPMSIGNVLLDVDPDASIRSITLSALVSPDEQVSAVAGGPACGFGSGGISALLFGDGTLQLADLNTGEPFASTGTPALAGAEAARVELTCSQADPTGEVSLEGRIVGQTGTTIAATVPSNGALVGAGFAAGAGEAAGWVHFDDLEVGVE
jgi:hypothetical protein